MNGKSLKARLIERISAHGPITVADYMLSCLADSEAGYYATREPFGEKGDFITAPEVSQMFGELIGAFFLQAYEAMGSPNSFQLVEMGPGRGTLMKDLLRMASLRPEFIAAAQLSLVETSARLREIQAKTLANGPLTPRFRNQLADLPPGPLFLVANEFFDALPVHQFVKDANGWHERQVGLSDGGQLVFGIGPTRLPDTDLPRTAHFADTGEILETQPASNAIAAEIGNRLARDGGSALVIDYGYTKSAPGDTLQALCNQTFDNVLANPGTADLTAHVNFEALAIAAHGAGAVSFTPLEQGEFLLKLGLLERAGALGSGKSPDVQNTIRDAVERLAAPDQMGRLFKVLALSGNSRPIKPFDSLGDTSQGSDKVPETGANA